MGKLVNTWLAIAAPKFFRFTALIVTIFNREDYTDPLVLEEKSEVGGGELCLLIESGTRGHDTLFYEQLLESAEEFFSGVAVYKVEIKNRDSYITERAIQIGEINPLAGSYYFWDPRTGSQTFLRGILEAFRTLCLIMQRGLIPIALLTDFPLRRWRIQTGIVTARNGVILTLSSNKYISPIMPHSRVLGPYIFPFSQRLIQDLIKKVKPMSARLHDVIIIGSDYEPRTSINAGLIGILEKKNLNVLRLGGNASSRQRITNTEYWEALLNSKIVFTTTEHATETKGDHLHVRHLIYRYLEAMACGCILVAQHVPSADHFLVPNVDYIPYDDIEDAARKIDFLLKNERELQKKSTEIQRRFVVIETNFGFWKFVMSSVTSNSIVKLE